MGIALTMDERAGEGLEENGFSSRPDDDKGGVLKNRTKSLRFPSLTLPRVKFILCLQEALRCFDNACFGVLNSRRIGEEVLCF